MLLYTSEQQCSKLRELRLGLAPRLRLVRVCRGTLDQLLGRAKQLRHDVARRELARPGVDQGILEPVDTLI